MGANDKNILKNRTISNDEAVKTRKRDGRQTTRNASWNERRITTSCKGTDQAQRNGTVSKQVWHLPVADSATSGKP